MNLQDLLTGAGNGAAINQIAQQLGISPDAAQQGMQALLPALNQGVRRNARQPGGLESLMGALNSGRHQQYLDQPEQATQPQGIAEGNAILGHIFGNKDVSRNVAANAAQQTGLGNDTLKKMLPMLATLAMGAMSKQTQAAPAQGAGAMDMLSNMLDADGDGSAADDLFNMARKFF